jgi:phenylacetate-CoA ligase
MISLNAIYTTAEKLLPHMKKNIEDVFDCDVYDNYGLNDGGVGAYECSEHNGLHIDTERSIMEVVDDSRQQISDGIGNVLATGLYNYAMPFIRYDTGDMGYIIEDKCGCGRKSTLLKEIIGRSVDILQTPEGKSVHGWFLLYIFWEYGEGIKEYQVIQKKIDEIEIKIVPDDTFNEKNLNIIKQIILEKSKVWNIKFRLVDEIKRTNAGKYKFIISNVKN